MKSRAAGKAAGPANENAIVKVLPFIAASVLTCSSLAFASSRSQRAHGAAVFTNTGCQVCHSIRGVGGHKGPDLSGVGRRKSKAELQQQIVHGDKFMPAFGDDLEPGDLKDLITYLKSCRQKPAKQPNGAKSNPGSPTSDPSSATSN
jgi:mono/diheme cytochrome c family protein